MKKKSKTSGSNEAPRRRRPASQLIDTRIKELSDDWHGGTLARLRTLIKQADPGVVEEWKWNVPVWSHGGIICTGEAYKKAVKLTFAKGASFARGPVGPVQLQPRRATPGGPSIFTRATGLMQRRLEAVLIRAAAALNASSAARQISCGSRQHPIDCPFGCRHRNLLPRVSRIAAELLCRSRWAGGLFFEDGFPSPQGHYRFLSASWTIFSSSAERPAVSMSWANSDHAKALPSLPQGRAEGVDCL